MKEGIASKLIIVEINFFLSLPQEIDVVVDQGTIFPLQLHLGMDKGEATFKFWNWTKFVIHTGEVVNHKLKNFEEA